MDAAGAAAASAEEAVCECCLEAAPEEPLRLLSEEYVAGGTREIYWELLVDCFDIALPTENNRLICEACVRRLREASSFKRLIVSTQLLLSQRRAADATKAAVSGEVVLKVEKLAPDVDYSPGHDSDDGCRDIKKEDPFTSDDDTPLLSSVRASETMRRRIQKERDKIEVKVETRRRPTEGALSSLPRALRETMMRLISASERPAKPTPNPSPAKSAPRPKTNETFITIPVSGSNAGEKGRCLKISLNPDYAKSAKHESASAPAKVERFLNSRERVVNNAIAFLRYSNVTPFKGKFLSGYRCYFCPGQYEPHALRQHTRLEHAELIRTGDIHVRRNANHFFMYLDVTDLRCELCAKGMRDLTTLRLHLAERHDKQMFPEFDDRHIPFRLDAEVEMTCLRCDKKFVSFRALEFHMNQHYGNCICEVCGDGFIEPKRLLTHMRSHATGHHPCAHCAKTFTNNHRKYMHEVAVHNVILRFRCPHCPERFAKYGERLEHMSAAHGVSRVEHRCKICGKLFGLSSTLNTHLRRDHNQERGVLCTLCDYRCFTRHELKRHMMRHTGQRLHRCEVCKKAYPRKTTLTQHMRIHNNDRRFVCALCGQAFVQNCSLKGHVKSHHPEVTCYETVGSEVKSNGAELSLV